MATPLETVLSHLDKVQRAGRGFKAICPAHADRTPSLSIKEGDDGRVLLHCFAGCDLDAVVAAIGLRSADLFCSETRPGKAARLMGTSLSELRQAVEDEKRILYIVKADQRNGRPISQADWERAKLALKRISLAQRVL